MKRRFIVAFGIATLLSGCSSEPNGGNGVREDENGVDEVLTLSRSEEQIAAAQNEFALTLFKTAQKGDENVMLSPLTTILSMSMGASAYMPEIKESILEKFGAEDIEVLHQYSKNVRKTLPAVDRKHAKVDMVFGLWYNDLYKGTEFNVDLSPVVTDYYEGVYSEYNFGETDVKEIINSWVSEKTNGTLPNLLSKEITSDARFVSVSTLDFKAQWPVALSEKNTRTRIFNNADGTSSYADFMMCDLQKGVKADKYVMNVLPFGNGVYEMVLLLPDQNVSIEEALEEVDYKAIADVLSDRESLEETYVTLPKFDLTYNFEATSAIKDSGVVTSAVNELGVLEFLEIYSGLNVSVDENGVSATASTATVDNIFWSAGETYKTVVYDRPFVFMIRESSSGLVMAIGKVSSLKK